MTRTIVPLLLALAVPTGCSISERTEADAGPGIGDSGGLASDAGPTADAAHADTGLAPGVDTGVASGPDAGTQPRVDSGGCLGSDFLASLGKDHVLAGFAGEDAVGKQAAFDLQYKYLAGPLADGPGPCASCATNCTSEGVACDNAHGCGWWGCWQWDQAAPGDYVRGFVKNTAANQAIPMVTYYLLLQASGLPEGTTQVAAANDQAFLARYLADFRLVLQSLGTAKSLVHVEPDFWGYCQHLNADPHAIPAKVKGANPTDCSGMENSIAGLGRCMIAMARKYAPNAKIGLHGSAWGTKVDVLMNTSPTFDVAGEAKKLGVFLKACGADEGDFVAVDASDRDAGWYQSQGKTSWWDATNATLPNFHQAFAWAKALAEEVGKPIVWWQVPVGNMAQANTNEHWKDNRVDYFFAHVDEIAAAHGVAMAFGSGATGQTTPSTDGGNLIAKVKAYATGGGTPLCR